MNSIQKKLLSIQFIGLGNTIRAPMNSRLRDRMERRYPAPTPKGPLQPPGRLLEVNAGEQGGRFRFENAELEIHFLAPDLVRVSWQPGAAPVPYALAQNEWPPVDVTAQENAGEWSLRSRRLSLSLRQDGSLRFCLPDGEALREELPPQRQALHPEGNAWVHLARVQRDERLFGLGEQSESLDLNQGSYSLWNTDPGGSYGPGTKPLYTPLPVYHGLTPRGSYLVFYENSFPAEITFGKPGPGRQAYQAGSVGQEPRVALPEAVEEETGRLIEARFADGMLRYYFIPGPPGEALERYTELTGRAPLPPRWALGYHQCRWGYKSETDIQAVVEGFRQHDLPISAVHLDIDYMDGYRVFTVDSTRFPDLGRLARELDERGIHLVTILDPGVKQDLDYYLYKSGLEENIFCTTPEGSPMPGVVWPGWAVFPDFTNPKARRWWASQYPRLLKDGISGFWHDMNEPSSFTAWGDKTLPLPTVHHLEGQGGDHRQAHNLYALLMNRAGYEGLRQHNPDKRPWILSRSGWAGQQRYAWSWTGDTETSWGSLRMTLTTVIAMAVSGLPYCGPDIGGFSGHPSPELYLRWFQAAAFLPFFRTHSALGTPEREPWRYHQPIIDILREFLRLRYRLMPYLYTLAWEAGQSGQPLVRPVWWPDGSSPELWDVEDAFLLGDALLVAPVLEEGAAMRQVLLPPGGWYDFWKDSRYQGPDNIPVVASLERIPLLVRGGSILPMEEDGRLVLHLYPPDPDAAERTVPLYQDEGDGYGAWRLDRFTLASQPDGLLLTWENEGQAAGEYPFPYPEVAIEVHSLPVRRALVDGAEVPVEENRILVPGFHQVRFEEG